MAKRFIHFYWGTGLVHDIPALAFYILVSLAPLVVGLASLAGLVFDSFLRPEEVAATLSERFPDEARRQIIALADSARNQILALALSLLAMVWTSSSALGVIERSETRLLENKAFPVFWGRARLLLAGAFWSMVLLLALAVSAWITGALPNLLGLSPRAYIALPGFFLFWLTCVLLYRFLPSPGPGWGRSALGGLLGSVGVLLAPLLLGFYAQSTPLSFGGIFSWVVLMIASCYFIALCLLTGSGISVYKGRG